jgi:hypothetical protein
MKKQLLKLDAKNRVCLTKLLKTKANQALPDLFRAYIKGSLIILEPIQEMPEREKLLFEPENEALLEKLKRGLEDGETTDLGSFSQYLDNE